MEWEIREIIINPWDDISIVQSRLGKFVIVQEDLQSIVEDIRTKGLTEKVELHTQNPYNTLKDADLDIPNLLQMFPEEDPETIVHQYLRARLENDRLTKEEYEGLFHRELHEVAGIFREMTYEKFTSQVKLELNRENEERRREMLFRPLATQEPIPAQGWKADHHRMRYTLEHTKDLGQIFQEMDLVGSWILAVFHDKFFQWGEQEYLFAKSRREKDPRIAELWRDGQLVQDIQDGGRGLFLYQPDTELSIRETEDHRLELDIEMEPKLFDSVLEMLRIPKSCIQSTEDIGMIGQFFFRNLYIPHLLFQDAIMNDPLLSSLLYINELRKSSFENRLPIFFRPFMCNLLNIVATRQDQPHIYLRNVHRQTGFQVVFQLNIPIKESRLNLFFALMTRIMGRFENQLRTPCIEEYTRFISDFEEQLARQQRNMVKNIKTERPEYFSRYPRMFVTHFYSTICQKNLQPELITEEEAREINPDRWIRFPENPIEEIQPEYYYCPNPRYPYAGLKEMNLSGERIFINYAPCCFNSPQGTANALRLKNVKTKNDMDDRSTGKNKGKSKKDNVINGKLIIKYPGQIGVILPPTMKRFLMAYDPMPEYFRMGIQQSPSSLISCLLQAREIEGHTDTHDPEKIRKRMAADPECIRRCLQQNPGLSYTQIQQDMADPNLYFDPRRFLPAVEYYFHKKILVFSRPAEIQFEDAGILEECSMRTLYTNREIMPVIIIFEHWGGKINILSRQRHPHNELVVFRQINNNSWNVNFVQKSFPIQETMRSLRKQEEIWNFLSAMVFHFDGKRAIFPLDHSPSSVTGQYVDHLGKVRALRFQIDPTTEFVGLLTPPIAIQKDVPVLEDDNKIGQPVPITDAVLRFLNRFTAWERIEIPDPDDTSVYWTVRQDRIMWKNLENSSSISFTFHLLLPRPRAAEIRAHIEENHGAVISIRRPLSFLLYASNKDNDASTYLKEEKIARCLYDLCNHAFSVYLQKNDIPINMIDPEPIIQEFFRTSILIEPLPPVMMETPEIAIHNLIRDGRLLLPSMRVWQKLKYNLKWLMFYNINYFYQRTGTAVMPSFYRRITDFGFSERYVFFHLEQWHQIFRYSVEKDYDLMTDHLMDLRELPDFPIWYRHDESPYPFPCILRVVRSMEECREISPDIWLWNPTISKWTLIEGQKESDRALYICPHKDTSFLILQPFQN